VEYTDIHRRSMACEELKVQAETGNILTFCFFRGPMMDALKED